MKVDPDLLLDLLQLQLHLFAQFEVQGAERLVEQQRLGPVDQGSGECHALLLAPRHLPWLAVLEPRHLHQRSASTTRDLPRPWDLLLRNPKATFSNTSRCGNNA